MIPAGERFSYIPTTAEAGSDGLLPFVPVSLSWRGRSIHAFGLVDSGAAVSVLPYQLGLDLGLNWDQQPLAPRLGGAYRTVETRLAKLMLKIEPFAPIKISMIWAKTESRLVLGQASFFMGFDICFHRNDAVFEIRPKA